jgi:hypothetical protein
VFHKSNQKSIESKVSVSSFFGSSIVNISSTRGASKSKEISQISDTTDSDFASVVGVDQAIESSKKSKTISEESSFKAESSFTIVFVSQKLNRSSS